MSFEKTFDDTVDSRPFEDEPASEDTTELLLPNANRYGVAREPKTPRFPVPVIKTSIEVAETFDESDFDKPMLETSKREPKKREPTKKEIAQRVNDLAAALRSLAGDVHRAQRRFRINTPADFNDLFWLLHTEKGRNLVRKIGSTNFVTSNRKVEEKLKELFAWVEKKDQFAKFNTLTSHGSEHVRKATRKVVEGEVVQTKWAAAQLLEEELPTDVDSAADTDKRIKRWIAELNAGKTLTLSRGMVFPTQEQIEVLYDLQQKYHSQLRFDGELEARMESYRNKMKWEEENPGAKEVARRFAVPAALETVDLRGDRTNESKKGDAEVEEESTGEFEKPKSDDFELEPEPEHRQVSSHDISLMVRRMTGANIDLGDLEQQPDNLPDGTINLENHKRYPVVAPLAKEPVTEIPEYRCILQDDESLDNLEAALMDGKKCIVYFNSRNTKLSVEQFRRFLFLCSQEENQGKVTIDPESAMKLYACVRQSMWFEGFESRNPSTKEACALNDEVAFFFRRLGILDEYLSSDDKDDDRTQETVKGKTRQLDQQTVETMLASLRKKEPSDGSMDQQIFDQGYDTVEQVPVVSDKEREEQALQHVLGFVKKGFKPIVQVLEQELADLEGKLKSDTKFTYVFTSQFPYDEELLRSYVLPRLIGIKRMHPDQIDFDEALKEKLRTLTEASYDSSERLNLWDKLVQNPYLNKNFSPVLYEVVTEKKLVPLKPTVDKKAIEGPTKEVESATKAAAPKADEKTLKELKDIDWGEPDEEDIPVFLATPSDVPKVEEKVTNEPEKQSEKRSWMSKAWGGVKSLFGGRS